MKSAFCMNLRTVLLPVASFLVVALAGCVAIPESTYTPLDAAGAGVWESEPVGASSTATAPEPDSPSEPAPAPQVDPEAAEDPVGDSEASGDMESVAPVAPNNQLTVLKPGLVVKVVVFVAGNEEISEERRIAENGFITLPLSGRQMVQGMTADELEQDLEQLYSERYFVNPTVEVSFVQGNEHGSASPWGFVTVLGRVKTPGPVNIPATQDMTLTLALQRAGGFDTSARQNAIRITRQMDGGRKKTLKVDLGRVGAEGKVEEDITLQPGDVVYVPESMF